MIDDLLIVTDLVERLGALLPLPARLTDELLAQLRKEALPDQIPSACTVLSVEDSGDLGGILCRLDLGPGVEREAFCSITHLRFDARMPLHREIVAYQKRRVKRLRRGG